MDSPPPRCLAWSKVEPFGAEFVEVRRSEGAFVARGVAIGSDPFAYRLDYELETTSGWVTSHLRVTARAEGWTRSLDLRRAGSGVWSETSTDTGANRGSPERPPTDLASLAGALDVDLGLSPLLNTPPVLRHGLHRSAGSVDFAMAWVSVPDLAVHPSPQRYTFVRRLDAERSVVRFESLGGDGFQADITYDGDGFVLEYPGIGKRM